MGLTAVIAASEPAVEGGGLRATLPLAGDALIEHQARQAARAGADQIVILAERIPAALASAVDRVRRNGVKVDIARSGADAADRIHPDARLLVMADGIVIDQAVIDRLLSAPGAAVAVLSDDGTRDIFERIDNRHRWAGVLVTSGDELAETVAMLGDWDLVSTLLRRTVQAAPARLSADAAGCVTLVQGAGAIDDVRAHLMAATSEPVGGWPRHYLYPPVEALLAVPILRKGVSPRALHRGALAAAALALPLFALLPIWAGLLVLLVSNLAFALGDRLMRLRLQAPVRRGWGDAMRWALFAAALAVIAYGLHRQGAGWGVAVLAIGLAVAQAAVEGQVAVLRAARGPTAAVPRWISDRDSLVLLVLPFAIGSWPVAGLAAAGAYAAVSLLWTQRTHLLLARRTVTV